MAMITSIKINYFRHCRSQDLSNAMWNWFIIIYYLLILIKISFILIMINLLSSAQLVEEESKLEKSLVEVEDQLEAKRGPLALAQTRLHTRRRRPNMERTRWDFGARGFVYVFFFISYHPYHHPVTPKFFVYSSSASFFYNCYIISIIFSSHIGRRSN